MNLESHPIRFVESLVRRRGADVQLSFSRYFHRPNSVFDERVLFAVRAGDVTHKWLEGELSGLPAGWELALNSKLTDERGRAHHIGLVDFAEGADLPSIVTSVRRYLGDGAVRNLWLFDSGRSYHGYMDELMIPKVWKQFLGRLLLMNETTAPQVTDARWVGHRLIGGYGALRWSMNSDRYVKMPHRVGFI